MVKTPIKNNPCGSFCGSAYGPFYGLGFLGAAVYYILQADTFWMGVLGIIKAIFWPAFLIYELFKYTKS